MTTDSASAATSLSAAARLSVALERRSDLLATAEQEATDALRLVHSEADGFPGLTVDRLADVILVEQHRAEVDAGPLLAALVERFGPEQALFLKERWSRRREDCDARQVAGPEHATELIIRERGLRFGLRLTDGEHVGLFLDARPIRSRVRELAEGLRVLNLYAYTGGFGLAAAAGGARSTTNVDNKRSALEHAQANYALNGLPADTRTFLRNDAIQYLRRARKGRGRYDLVVLDPPPRSHGRRSRTMDAAQDYAQLAASAMRVLDREGWLLAGLNALRVDDEGFRAALDQAGKLAGRATELVETLGAGPDFPPSPDRPTARFALLRCRME